MGDRPEFFVNANQVFAWLQERYPGRKVSLRTVHNHFGTHRLPLHDSGVCLLQQVETYARALKPLPAVPTTTATSKDSTGEEPGIADELLAEKLKRERAAANREIRKDALEAGRLMPTAEHVPALITAIHVVERNVRTRLKKSAGRIVAAADGDMVRRKAVSALLMEAVDEAMHVFSETEQFRIQFEEWGDDAE